MQLENLHAYMHINALVNGTAEVLFMGQPALTVHKAASVGGTQNGETESGYCWTINNVFAKLTYGANVLSDVPYCTNHYSSIEHAAAEGMAKLEELGAFKTITELPDDTYSNAKKFVEDDIVNHAMSSGKLTESIKYITTLKLQTHKPSISFTQLSEKVVAGETLTESELTARAEFALMGKHIFYGDLVESNKGVESHPEAITDAVEPAQSVQTEAVVATTLFEAFKAQKRDKLIEESYKLVSTHDHKNRTAKVYKCSDTGEHVVKFFEDGKHNKAADYFVDGEGSKEDAQGTARHWISKAPVSEATRSEFDANNALSDKRLAKDKSIRIVGPTGGTVSKHTSLSDAKRTFIMKKFSTKTHTIKEDTDTGEVDLTLMFEDSDTEFAKWKAATKEKHSDKNLVFRHRIERGMHTTSAEIPGEERAYAIYDHDKDTGHVFDMHESIVGEEVVEERELSDAEKAKKEEIVTALKGRKGVVSKYGKDAIYAVATQMAKTAGA